MDKIVFNKEKAHTEIESFIGGCLDKETMVGTLIEDILSGNAKEYLQKYSDKFLDKSNDIANNSIIGGGITLKNIIDANNITTSKTVKNSTEVNLSFAFGRDICFKIDDNGISTICVDNIDTDIRFSSDVLKNIDDYVLIFKKLLSRQFSIKVKPNLRVDQYWSYVNEKKESKTWSEQKEYNQSLFKMIYNENIDTIELSYKLKPLVETFIGFDKDRNILSGKLEGDYFKMKGKYVSFIFNDSLNETLIYSYKSNSLNMYDKILDIQDLNFLSELLTDTTLMKNVKVTEIIIDNGMFNIKNKKTKIENGKKIILNIKPNVEDSYIESIAIFVKTMFNGINSIDIKEPEHKYTYHYEIFKKYDEEINKQEILIETTDNNGSTDTKKNY